MLIVEHLVKINEKKKCREILESYKVNIQK